MTKNGPRGPRFCVGLSGSKVSRLRRPLLRLVSDSPRGTGSLVAARCGGSCFQNASGSGKDAGRALVGDFLFGFQPVLNIATVMWSTT